MCTSGRASGRSVVSDSVRPYGQQPTRLLCPLDSLGKNTGVGCHFLFHLIMPLRGEGSCGGGGAPRDSAGSGATEEGLTSRGGLLVEWASLVAQW